MTSNASPRCGSDFVKDTKSTMEKPAKEIYESRDIGRPTVDCQFVKPSRRWRVKGKATRKAKSLT